MVFSECNNYCGSSLKDALSLGDCYAVLALDVKKVFNSSNWHRIKGALAGIEISGYLASLVKNNFAESTLWYRRDKDLN